MTPKRARNPTVFDHVKRNRAAFKKLPAATKKANAGILNRPPEKRKTWRDRPRGSVAFMLDIVSKEGGRCVLEAKPFESTATPAQATTEIVRTLAIYFGPFGIDSACWEGIKQARTALAKAARKRKAPR